jgi:hypothetical protein
MAQGSAFITYDGDGSTAEFTYPFVVRGAFSSIIVKVMNDGDDGFVTQIEDTHYTVDEDSRTVTFESAYVPDAGTDNVRIERFTTRTRRIDYSGGGSIREEDLDNDANRLTSVDEEIEDGITNALLKDDSGEWWQGEGLRSHNCSPATTQTGWVTLAQMQNAIDGQVPAVVENATVVTFTGDGTTTEYELVGWQGLNTPTVEIHVDRAYQEADGNTYEVLNSDDSAYPSQGTTSDFVVFDTAPINGASIEMKIFSGTVATTIGDSTVTGDSIVADAIDETHINIGAGNDKRFFVFNTTGDPVGRTIGPADFAATGQTPSGAFNTGVRTSRLDQMAAPTAAVDLNSQRINNLASPSVATDAASKAYVDSLIPSRKEVTGDLTPGITSSNQPFTLGFRPDLLVITGEYDSANEHYANWTFVFGGLQTRKMIGGTTGSTDAHVVQVEATNTGFKYKHTDPGGGDATITNCRYFAIKV